MTICRERLVAKLVPALMIFSVTVAYPYQQALPQRMLQRLGLRLLLKTRFR